MVRVRLHDFLGCRFRANPLFELVEHGRLPVEQREDLKGFENDSSYFGVLVPRDHGMLGVHAVSRETAQLFSTLGRPGPLPARALERPGADSIRQIAGLVLDGVLEVEFEGDFLTGPAAHAVILEEPCAEPRLNDAIAELSCEALRRARGLPIEDPEQLSAWLYAFHALPVGPRWVRLYGRSSRLEDALGLGGSTAAGRMLEDAYQRTDQPSWLLWRRRERRAESDGPGRGIFKLYVSPHPSAVAEAFRSVASRLDDCRVRSFKLGRDTHGILRPDKLVLYLEDRPSLSKLAAGLSAALRGCPAHGVPFTASLSADGLLSWGLDPPPGNRPAGRIGKQSWRAWVTGRLARGILRARSLGGGDAEPWLYALDRLRVDGVDTDGWLPAESIWDDGILGT